jgi:GT2 family glycosyltransferase
MGACHRKISEAPERVSYAGKWSQPSNLNGGEMALERVIDLPRLGLVLRKPKVITLADRARDEGQWELAAHLYRKALERNPGNPAIWVQYGHALKESGELRDPNKLAQAEAAYRRALSLDAGAADSHMQLAHVLKLQGRTSEAEASYLCAFALDPSMHYALQELGGLSWSAAQLSELQRLAERESPPPMKLTEMPSSPDLERLNNLLYHEFGDEARRVVPYFSIIEAVRLKEGCRAPSRREIIVSLVERMRRLSRAAGDSRSVEASIIITAFEHVEYTIACVISLLEHKCNTRYEIIIGNNASFDETRDIFEAIGGVVRCITHEKNEGFLKNCNLSAKHANGKYIVLINNDTLILDQWLDELLAPFVRFNGVGLVGSKLLMVDGSLQEAGGIIWRDGSGWNFGREQDPTLYQYNYVKEVDYVSGASIAIVKSVWDDVGGFDERYIPAYYEDADLAFQIRAKGLRTLYSPRSQVIHHEGVTHGTDVSAGIKAYQVENQDKFVAKWQALLSTEHNVNGEHVFTARDRSRYRKHMLVVDHYVPQFDRDAGSRMMFDYLKMFVDAGFQISFWPNNLHYDRQYVKLLQDFGIEVLYSWEFEAIPRDQLSVFARFADWIKQYGVYLDYAVLSRGYIGTNYINDIADNSAAKILYFGHDLTFPSLEQEYAVTGRTERLEAIERWRSAETSMWKRSDIIYYPAQYEVDWVAHHAPGKEVRILPVYVYPDKEIHAARARLHGDVTNRPTVLFVGGFAHPPNSDAVSWFVREILPIVKGRIPEIVTIVAGSNPPPEVTSLASEDVVVTGYISDPVLEWFYLTSSLVIAPLRFGGGMKGKIIEATRFAVPVVTTTCGAEGFAGAKDFLEVADTPKDFANSVIRILRDPRRARKRVLNGLAYVERECGYSSVSERLAADIPELRRLHEGRGLLKQ